MSAAHRTGGTRGMLEIDVRLLGFGRFRISAATYRVRVAKRREALARQLAENGQLGTLRALKDGDLAWPLIEQAQKQQRLNDPSLLADLRVRALLWPAIAATLPRLGRTPASRLWYKSALAHLRTLGFSDAAIIRDLARDDWPELLERWTVSPATKNGLRRAVSRFLTRYLGKKTHAFRLTVIDEESWPVQKVPEKLRGVRVEQFWKLMARVDEHLVPSYVTLAASGMRVGEYLNDAALELDPDEHVIYVAGKTGPKPHAVAADLWAYVEAACPCRVARITTPPTRIQNDARYKKLYRQLAGAGKALGIRVTIHDLRKLYARLGVQHVGETATQTALGHETAEMTRHYARWDSRRQVARAVGRALMSGKKSGKLPAEIRSRTGTERHP